MKGHGPSNGPISPKGIRRMSRHLKSPLNQKKGRMKPRTMSTSVFLVKMTSWKGGGFYNFHAFIGGLDAFTVSIRLFSFITLFYAMP